jgi:hypothetical protein
MQLAELLTNISAWKALIASMTVFASRHDVLLSFAMSAHAYGVRTSFLSVFAFFSCLRAQT